MLLAHIQRVKLWCSFKRHYTVKYLQSSREINFSSRIWEIILCVSFFFLRLRFRFIHLSVIACWVLKCLNMKVNIVGRKWLLLPFNGYKLLTSNPYMAFLNCSKCIFVVCTWNGPWMASLATIGNLKFKFE